MILGAFALALALDPALIERRELLTLAPMAYLHAEASRSPYAVVAALIAWEVEDLKKTPDFILERSKNLEKMAEIHHAEREAVEEAYRRKNRGLKQDRLPASTPAFERFTRYTNLLAGTELYSTLEPCPMCAGTLLLARVPKAIYALEDPGLRGKDRKPNVPVASEVYGRTLDQKLSPLPLCRKQNEAMWKEAGKPDFNVIRHIVDNLDALYRPAYQDLFSRKAAHPENAELLKRLRAAVGRAGQKGRAARLDSKTSY